MSNLSIENLSGLSSKTMGGGIASEARVTTEMKANGMAVPDSSALDRSGHFSEMLSSSMEKVNNDQIQADRSIKELVAGRSKNIHETMLTIERADASLKLMMQVRNKVLDAYKEIMRMQV
jgi:flagellar hook-basal body complex protein FliE